MRTMDFKQRIEELITEVSVDLSEGLSGLEGLKPRIMRHTTRKLIVGFIPTGMKDSTLVDVDGLLEFQYKELENNAEYIREIIRRIAEKYDLDVKLDSGLKAEKKNLVYEMRIRSGK